MKQTLLIPCLAFLLLSVQDVMAQPSRSELNFMTATAVPSSKLPIVVQKQQKLNELRNNNKILFAKYMNSKMDLSYLERTTAGTSNISAVVNKVYDADTILIPSDSSIYTFSGTHGGDMTSKYILFDNEITYNYSGASYENARFITQTITGSRPTDRTTEFWDEKSSSWYNYTDERAGFDPSGNILTYEQLTWNPFTVTWDPATLVTYNYIPGTSNLASIVQQNWNTTTDHWDNAYQAIYNYDPVVGTLTSIVYTTWDAGTSSWDNTNMDSYQYDPSGNMLTDLWQDWNAATSTWVNDNVFNCAYTAGLLNFVAYQTWNASTASWVTQETDNYTYDHSNNPINLVQQLYNSTTHALENSFTESANYNTFNQPTYIWSQQWNGSNWQTLPQDFTITLYYSGSGDKPTSVGTINTTSNLSVYPNPAVNSFTVSTDFNAPYTLKVFSANGQLVGSYQLDGSSSNISVQNIPSGVYFINILQNGKSSVKQLAIQH